MARSAHAIPVQGCIGPILPVFRGYRLVGVEMIPSPAFHIPGDWQTLHPAAGKRYQVLLKGVPSEGVDDLEIPHNAFRSLGVDKKLVVLAVEPGDNTEYSTTGTEIIALIDGNAFLEENRVCVEPLVRVDRVDYETGNIHFDGSVIVKGRIADGFTIEAGGSVEIGECVGRALVSAGRDVLLKGGMNGDGEGTIKATGSITSKYIENARISCGRDLLVQELLLNSDFVVGANLVLRGRRGELLGGSGVVGGNLWCKQLGSQAEVQTRVSVGIQPAVLQEFVNLKMAVEEKSLELDKVRNEILGLEKLLSYAQGRRGKISTALRQQKERATELRTELTGLKGDLVRCRRGLVPDAAAQAVIEGTMHPGSVVAFGEEEFRSDDHAVAKTVLRLDNGRVVEGGFNPQAPPMPFV